MEKEFNELSIIVLPSGKLQVEWVKTKDFIPRENILYQNEVYKSFMANTGKALLLLGLGGKKMYLSPSVNFWMKFAKIFTSKLTLTPDLEKIRGDIRITLEEDEIEDTLENLPPMVGAEYINKKVLSDVFLCLQKTFKKEIKKHKESVESFLQFYSSDLHVAGQVYFHLAENKKDKHYPFAFLATYTPEEKNKKSSRHIPLRHALEKYENNQKKLLELLSTVSLAAKKSSSISNFIETGKIFQAIKFSSREALEFLKEVPLYEQSGVICRIPNWWKAKKSSFSINVNVGEQKSSLFGTDSLLDFDIHLCLNGENISKKEIDKILQESQGLVLIKNNWVEVDREKLNQLLSTYERTKELIETNTISLKDAVSMEFHNESLVGDDKDLCSLIEVSNGKWLKSVIQKLKSPSIDSKIKTSIRFKAKLRPYQKKGLSWLCFLRSLNLGGCLADDMGLGKTVQVLAFLDTIKKTGKKETRNKASLLIIPTSLLSNWMSEIVKFAPHIKIFVVHAGINSPKKIKEFGKRLSDKTRKSNLVDLVISTYASFQKFEWVKEFEWNYIILDEAQAIKNPSTKQTIAVKKLKSQNRLIMTGTPIENRVSDLWSLFDFLNPGLLGTVGEFSEFMKSSKESNRKYAKLRKIVSPYVLRRLKTDKSIITDLPAGQTH